MGEVLHRLPNFVIAAHRSKPIPLNTRWDLDQVDQVGQDVALKFNVLVRVCRLPRRYSMVSASVGISMPSSGFFYLRSDQVDLPVALVLSPSQ